MKHDTKALQVTLLSALLVVGTGTPGWSDIPSERSCDFISAFQIGKPEAISSMQETMRLSGGEGQRIIAETINELSGNITGGEVLEFANVGGFVVEHFIVLNSVENGNDYFRIVYEKYANGLFGVNFVYYSQFDDALDGWPILQDPVQIQCQ